MSDADVECADCGHATPSVKERPDYPDVPLCIVCLDYRKEASE